VVTGVTVGIEATAFDLVAGPAVVQLRRPSTSGCILVRINRPFGHQRRAVFS
jgi:hypothetical protein